VSTQPVAPTGDSQVTEAVTDLAARLDIDESDITVTANERVTWPDGSLGCPQPGMAYTQMLVDGSLVVLEFGSLFYCAFPTAPVPGSSGDS